MPNIITIPESVPIKPIPLTSNRSGRQRRLKRQRIAFQMVVKGATYYDISIALRVHWGIKVSQTTVFKDVQDFMDRHEKYILKDARKWVRLEMARLDRMLFILEPKIVEGDIKAIDCALRIMERRAKYLGLDAPEKLALTGPTGQEVFRGGSVQSEIRILIAEIGPLAGSVEGQALEISAQDPGRIPVSLPERSGEVREELHPVGSGGGADAIPGSVPPADGQEQAGGDPGAARPG